MFFDIEFVTKEVFLMVIIININVKNVIMSFQQTPVLDFCFQ